MPSLQHFVRRRKQFLAAIDGPVLLMAGGQHSRNYPQNPHPYRPDSNWLFLFPSAEPDAAALFDPKDGTVTLFLNERTPEDALWHGPVPSFKDMKKIHAVSDVRARAELGKQVKGIAGKRKVRSLAVADFLATAEAAAITGEDLRFHDSGRVGDPALIQAIGQLRARKTEEELVEMRATAAITREAFVVAMAHTRPGIREQHLVGHVEGTFARHGCVPAYNTILSVRGEVLHNHAHDNILLETDIVLLDAGAESRTGYCSDVTRCWPVGGQFSPEGRDIYDIVLAAEMAAIEAVRPGVRYRDIHLAACRVVAAGLAGMGLLQGSLDELVETGAHALFFPHGVGHLIGLDVHDMETFGDAIAYPKGRSRSTQFGTAYLRLDMDLEPGMCFTIEPGIYFVPAILRDKERRKEFRKQVDFGKAETFLTMNGLRGFGGIRIEDDVHCTELGAEVLTAAVPKDRVAVEALVGSAGA